jgi:hypothetical protein
VAESKFFSVVMAALVIVNASAGGSMPRSRSV